MKLKFAEAAYGYVVGYTTTNERRRLDIETKQEKRKQVDRKLGIITIGDLWPTMAGKGVS